MANLNLRSLFVAFTAFFLNFSAIAAEERLTYIPGKYELARRAKTLFDPDKELVNSALEVILRLLEIQEQETDNISEAEVCLQKLRHIHFSYRIGSPERMGELKKLGKQAKNLFLRHTKKLNDSDERDLNDLMNSHHEDDKTVKNFITHFLNGFHDYDRIMLQGAGAVGVGLSVGCGGAVLTYPSGDRCIAMSVSLGLALFLGADVALEHHRGMSEGESWFKSSWRYHWTRIFGDTREIVKRNKIYGGYSYDLAKTSQGCTGLAAGIGNMEVRSAIVDLPLIPLFPNYDFPRQLLGITYPPDMLNRRHQ